MGEGSCGEGWSNRLEAKSEDEEREEGLVTGEEGSGLQASLLIRLMESQRLP